MKVLVMRMFFPLFVLFASTMGTAMAGGADVVDVSVKPAGSGKWQFDVTVRHGDTGWDHYADRWEVLGPDGAILGTRILAHPHVNEQPFTRSAVIDVPADLREVTVRARDSVHGFGGAELGVSLLN